MFVLDALRIYGAQQLARIYGVPVETVELDSVVVQTAYDHDDTDPYDPHGQITDVLDISGVSSARQGTLSHVSYSFDLSEFLVQLCEIGGGQLTAS